MATSDVLQFRYCIDNEIARNATKNFAGMLGKAFEQYKKLWIEYLKLQKHCENADVKIPFQLFDPTSDNNDIVILSHAAENCTDLCNEHTSKTSANHSEVSSSEYASLPTMYTSDCTLTINEKVLADDKVIDEKQIVKNELLRSPVLIRQRKSKKNHVTPGPAILDDSDEINVLVPVRENITILANSSDEDLSETSLENNENQFSSILNNNDQIECTPVSKLPKKLGVSKLYNIDTTLLQNGKKLKQSRLVFLATSESKETIDQKNHKELTSLMPPDNSGYSKDIEEEIIEDSPTKRKNLKLRMKSMKLRKKSPLKLRENSHRKYNLFGKFSDNKIAGLSQCLPVHTSTQKDELQSIRKLKTCSISNNEKIGNNHDTLTSCPPPIFADIQLKSETENVDTNNTNDAQKRKLSKLFHETNSSYNDETFCLLGEKLKEKSASKIDNIENNKDELSKNVSHYSPPVKKSFMNSFDMVPEKEDVFTLKTKNKIERAKLAGTSCWECEKYYGNLGLSERELKARQKQCSRHRISSRHEKPSTPEGFWDPLFPDTYSSTFRDD